MRNFFLFPCSIPFSFMTSVYTLNFHLFLGLSVPAILLFFCFLLFHLEIFFSQTCSSFYIIYKNKLLWDDLCKYFQISATVQHYPYALSAKKKGRKKAPKNESELNPSESCN